MDFYLRTVRDNNNIFHADKPGFFWGQGENDLIVDAGDFATVSGKNYLAQSMAKILVTEPGANKFFPAYGSGLQNLVGANMDLDFLRANVKSETIDSLRIYQFINKTNSDLDEQIDMLQSLKIDQILNDGINVSFTVITRAGTPVGSTVSIEG